MTLQYDQRNINLQEISAVTSFIFDANATDQSDISFNNWTTLIAKAQEVPGIKEIIIASEGGGTSAIPAGTYDMTNIRLVGETAFSSILTNDVIFQNLEYIENLTISNTLASASPVFVYDSPGPGIELTLKGVTMVIGAAATQEMIAISNGTTLLLDAEDSSFFSSNAGVPVITVDATSVLSTGGTNDAARGNSWGGPLGSNPFVNVAGGGTFVLQLGTGDVYWDQDQTNGATGFIRADDYEAAVVGDWNGTEPENVKNALDRIAAALGPIA